MKNIEKGRVGEALAIQYLQNKNYHLITQNYRYKRAEIDIIVQKGNFIAFVEVKYRTNISYGLPEENISPRQIARIIEAAENYLLTTATNYQPRFDIIAIISRRERNSILHIKDAF